MINAALLGNPNCGKTTLFNALTGSTAYTGNWPGVTVEKREGTYKNKKNPSLQVRITDLPGIYSLSPYSPEEVISRNYILNEKPDVVISVIDATNLERNLYMTTQLLEMDVPVVIALNMSDALEENNQSIDTKILEKQFNVPVISISALKYKGLDDLMKMVEEVASSPRKGVSYLPFKETLEKASKIYEEKNISSPLFHAVKALEKDELELDENKEASEEVLKACESDGVDYESSIADERYKFLSPLCDKAIKGKIKEEKEKLTRSDKIDRILTNKWLAIPIMIVILFVIFHIVFAGDLFYMNAMGLHLENYPGFISFMVGGEEVHPFEGLFYNEDGIPALGEFLHSLAGDSETGILGLISLGIKEGMIQAGASEWVIGLVYDGILGGVTAVLGFVPQIMLLFAFFSLLEDSGYMARIAFVLDRILRKFGVSGRAFLPMIMGFGCGVPAMMNTRTLATDAERTKTIRAIPFFTCGAKAEFLVTIAAAVAAVGGLDAGLFTFVMYLLGVVVALISVIVMTKTTQREKVPPFIMELPAYHLPAPKALALHVYDKGKHFVIKAFTIIFLSTVAIWFLSNFSWGWEMVPEEQSILHDLGQFIAPIFTPCGFGVQTGDYGWTFSVASIQGIVAKEAVTQTIEQISGSLIEGGDFSMLVSNSGITQGGLVGFAVFNMLTIPCFASVATAKGELKDHKTFVWTILFWVGLSYLLGCLAYVSVDYVWSLGITIPALIAAGVGLYFYDRHMNKKEAMAN